MFQKYQRKIKHMAAKLLIRFKERSFHYNGRQLKYLYLPAHGSNALAVVFSGFPDVGKPATYNMVSSFMGLKINRLYILDNFGYANGGTYYLGEEGNFHIQEMVLALLERLRFPYRVFLGSSKGGTSAIYFGLLSGCDQIIAGAPQMYIGSYLTSKPEHIPIMDALAGDHTAPTIERYDRILPNLIKTGTHQEKTNIILHYSINEHTYHEHIRDMISLLEEKAYHLEHDVSFYNNHSDVACFFPQLCIRKLKMIIEQCS